MVEQRERRGGGGVTVRQVFRYLTLHAANAVGEGAGGGGCQSHPSFTVVGTLMALPWSCLPPTASRVCRFVDGIFNANFKLSLTLTLTQNNPRNVLSRPLRRLCYIYLSNIVIGIQDYAATVVNSTA